jgi:hypothetical protein
MPPRFLPITFSGGISRGLRGACALAGLLAAASLAGQPSGGPYGPIARTYALPEVSGAIYYVAPDGDASAPGTALERPTSLEAAFARVVTGDAIVLRGGTYRTGDLLLNQGITLQPYADEVPVWKGTRIATAWTPLRDGLWKTSWETLFPMAPESWWRREREGMRTPLHRFHNDMVFVDGRFLQSAGWEGEVDEDTFYINYETGEVFIGLDPTGRTIEITAFDNAFTRITGECHGRASDGRGPVLRGITFTRFAYRAIEIGGYDPEGLSPESAHGKDVVGTIIEDCTITYCSRVAAYLRGDHLVLRRCLISDTSTEGIFLLSSNDVLFEKNIFARNNIERITGYYPSAVKIFNQCYRVTCRDNLVIDHPHSNGIWYDVGNVDGVFINNWIVGALDGFFFEISEGAICAGNVFVDCDKGVRVLNAADVEVYQNTFINCPASFERTPRGTQGDHFGWHPSTGPDVDERDGHVFRNNLLIAEAHYRQPLLRFEQTASLCGRLTGPQVSELDHNVYVRLGPGGDQPLLTFSPAAGRDCAAAYADLEDFRAAHPAFEAHGLALAPYAGPLVRSLALQRYELAPDFPGIEAAGPLPEAVRALLGRAADTSFPGAFPVRN